MEWEDITHTLCLNARKGSYPGMPSETTVRVRVAGGDEERVVQYRGENCVRVEV